MADEPLDGSKTAVAAQTKALTGAVLAQHETRPLLVSDKSNKPSSAWPGKSKYTPVDPGGEMISSKSS